MTHPKIHYCFILSAEQMEHLRSKKYKIDRMECFMSLLALAEREKKLVPLSKTQQVELLPGQFMVDYTRLSELWGKDRKTVPKLMKAMEALGIFSSQKVGDTLVYTLHSLSAWYVDGAIVPNEFGLKRSGANSAIIHKEVPPARVIIIEPEEPKKSDGGNSNTTEMKSHEPQESASHPVSDHLSLPLSPSEKAASVGKSSAEVRLPEPLSDRTSHQSKAHTSTATDTHSHAGAEDHHHEEQTI